MHPRLLTPQQIQSGDTTWLNQMPNKSDSPNFMDPDSREFDKMLNEIFIVLNTIKTKAL